MKRWGWVILASASLVFQPAILPEADAGYSSGRTSVSRSPSRSSSASRSRSSSSSSASRSRSSSSSSRSSSSYSSGKSSSYSSGKSSSYSSGKTPSASPSSSSRGTGSFGSAAASAQRRAESGSRTFSPSGRYSAGSLSDPARRSSYERSRQLSYLRSRMDDQSYTSRPVRAQRFYGSYFGRPAMGFNDGYSPWFWLWLMDRNNDQRAAWAYNHRDTMDPQRYQALVGENAELRQRIDELERSGQARDPMYVPPELSEPDLMYSDTYAAAATQPAVEPAPEDLMPDSPDPGSGAMPAPWPSHDWRPARSHSGPGLIAGLFVIAVLAGLVGLLIRASRGRERWSGFAEDWSADRAYPPPLPRAGDERDEDGASEPAPVDNPLNLALGQRFQLDLPEHAGLDFAVEQIVQYTTRVGSERFNYTAYWGIARPPGGERTVVQLRVERLRGGGLAVLALRLHDQFEYSQDFHNIVATDGTGLFQITDDDTGEVTAEYYRPEGVLDSYTASVVPQNRTGDFGSARTIRYWDYSRNAQGDRGTFTEYLIVEMEDSGWFRILVGPEIDAARVR